MSYDSVLDIWLLTAAVYLFILIESMSRKSRTPHRSYRVADQIQRDLSELIERELKDPRVGIITLQGVEVTPDYAHAKVFFSVLTGDAHQAQEALNHAAGFLRNALFKRLHLHTVPTLHFVYDQTQERAAEMNALIAHAVALAGDNDDADNTTQDNEP